MSFAGRIKVSPHTPVLTPRPKTRKSIIRKQEGLSSPKARLQRIFQAGSGPAITALDEGTASPSALNAPPGPLTPLISSVKSRLADGRLVEQHVPIVSPILARDACRCSKCIDPSDRQRNFSYADIPPDIAFREVNVIEEARETLVRWQNDAPPHESGHTSVFDRQTIANLKSEFRNWKRWALYERPQRIWDAGTFSQETSRIDFNDYMNDAASFANAMHLLWRDGLVFIDGVPESEDSVSQIVNRIGPLQQTFYGPTWDVRSVPDAKNVAYTSKHLGFHMDLLYMRDPPGFQFLHCVHNSCQGGESRFADTFNAIDQLASQNRDQVRTLTTYPVRYEYDNDGFFYSDAKPTIVTRQKVNVPFRRSLNARNPRILSDVANVFWSPPFVGNISPMPSHDELADFVRASKAFADLLDDPANVVQEKMDSGTCVIFDNLRIVHARNAFDKNSGKRWLRGAYLNRQDFVSKAVAVMDGMPANGLVDLDAEGREHAAT